MKAMFEGVEASTEEWQAAGATLYNNNTVQFSDLSGRRYQIFLQACFAVGRANGSEVIAWMLTEQTRQDEEAARIRAQHREADSVKGLRDVIERLADRIERLQETLKSGAKP